MTTDKANWLNRFISASFWASSTSYIFFTINFLGQIVLARLLSPHDFGIYAFALALRELGLIFLGFTTNQTFIQSQGRQVDFNASVIIALFSAGLFFVLGIIGGGVLYFIYSWQYAFMLFLACFAQLFNFLGRVHLAPLEKNLNYKKVALSQGGASTISLLAAIFSALFGLGLWSLAIREIIQGVTLLLLALVFGELYFSFKKSTEGLYQQLSFGFKTAVSRGLEVLYYRFPDVVIQFFLGQVSLGYFYQARYLAYLPIKLTTPFSQQVLFSYLTGIVDDKEKFKWHLYWINYVISRLLLPFALIIYFFGPQIFVLIYGAKWQMAGEYFRYFSIFIFFASLFSGLQSACYSLHKQAFVSQAYLVAISIFLIGVMLITKQQYSALVFSIGLVVAYFYLFIYLWYRKITLPVGKLFLKPLSLFLVAELISRADFSLATFILSLLVLLILFYWSEQRDFLVLLKRIRAKD